MSLSAAGLAGALRDGGATVLDPVEIADAVVHTASRGAGTAVNEILVRPTEQSR